MSNAAGLHSFPDDSSEPLSEETGRGKAAIEKDRVGREAHFIIVIRAVMESFRFSFQTKGRLYFPSHLSELYVFIW